MGHNGLVDAGLEPGLLNSRQGLFPLGLALLCILSLSSSSHLRFPLDIGVGDQGCTVEVRVGPLTLPCVGCASLKPISFREMLTTSMVRFFDCRASLKM